MNKDGPIVIIENDLDDQAILTEILIALNYTNKILFFGDGIAALAYLNKSSDKRVIILSDINLPKLDGFELRDKIHNNVQLNRTVFS